MASEFTLYSSARKYVLDGTVNPASDTLKLMLVTSAYVPDISHEVLADVTGFTSPSPEVEAIASPDNGYIAGGQALTGQVASKTDSPSQGKFDADNLTFASLTATFRYGILYAEKTVGSPAIVNPLIGYILYDNTPADISVSGVPWTTQWSADGIITN